MECFFKLRKGLVGRLFDRFPSHVITMEVKSIVHQVGEAIFHKTSIFQDFFKKSLDTPHNPQNDPQNSFPFIYTNLILNSLCSFVTWNNTNPTLDGHLGEGFLHSLIKIVSICHANSRETVQGTILMQKVVKYCPWALFIGQSELSYRSEI